MPHTTHHNPPLPDHTKPASVDEARFHARLPRNRKDQREKHLEKEAKKRDDRKDFFAVGTLCMLFENPIKSGSTVKQRPSGPYAIVNIKKGNSTCTVRSTKTHRLRTVAITKLKRVKQHL